MTVASFFCCLLLCQVTPQQVSPQNPQITPAEEALISSYSPKALEKWEKEIVKLEEKDSTEPDPENAILFIGSSSIRRWETIAQDMAPWPVIRRGFGGSRFTDLIVFTERLVAKHNYRALAIFIGNDITGGKDDKTPQQVLELFQLTVKLARKSHPDKPIFFIPITPNSQRFHVWSAANAANQLIKQYVQSDPLLHYIDTVNHYLDADGKPRDELFVEDKLHQNQEGYKIWSKVIKDHLVAKLKEPIPGASNQLASKLTPLIQAHQGEVSVAVKHLSTGAEFTWEADRAMPTASLIKFPVMIEAYRQQSLGKVDFSARIELKPEDKVPGSGILTNHFSSVSLSLKDAIQLMIAFSDNTATNLVIDQIGLPSTAAAMEQLGCPNTKLNSKVYRRELSIFPDRSQQFGLGSTTAREMVSLLERLEQGQLVSAEASKLMKQHMLVCDDATKLKRFLPAGTKVAHKTGAVSATRTDAGLIDSPSGPIAICVLTNDNKDQSWGDDNAAQLLCANIGKVVYEHFNPVPIKPAPSNQLQNGSLGEMVEALQRTLNVRSEPSPKLSTDGDFGPATEAAVKAFQRKNNLPETGIVDQATWQKLGPLVEPVEVADPQVVNSAELPRSAIEPMQGPPWVSCPSWAIADGVTGKVLSGENVDEPRDPASTTKIMTALVVLKMAEAQPELLDETIVFSTTADETTGSTAAIRAGEKLSARELLYGLLLPSGNDASVAFAEHFGAKLNPKATTPQQAYDAFIAEMNATAKRLGMKNSNFTNPHGLTDQQHKMSASDLCILAHQAMQLPLFRQVVATRQRGCTVQSTAGYTRNVKWENTNELLGTDGYLGIKTGTTSAAGACLVSQAERDGKSRICVILGSGNSRARYADTRNLLRWSWLLSNP
jgi:serine-type D-Ala-D-Ala carboxypeptidase (penicillin-binding protein 5/6)